MPWFGPCGTCGCDGGGCTCPSPCECYDRYGPGLQLEGFLGFVTGHTLTLSGFPYSVSFTYRPFTSTTDSTITISGLNQFNDTFSWPLPSPAVDPSLDIFCQDECYATTIATKTVTVSESGGTYSGNPETCGAPGDPNSISRDLELRFATASSAPGSQCGFGIYSDSLLIPVDCGCEQSPVGWLSFFELVQFIADPFNRGDRRCVNFAEGTITNSGSTPGQSGLVVNCSTGGGNVETVGPIPIAATLAPVVSQGGAPILGWNYNVSNVPSSFYLRISNGVKSYQITGMDVLNGDYELELDDESDCSKSGIEFLSFDITAQEFQISTSSPCTVVPVGSTISATARLALPPTSVGVVVTIRIPGENDKSILIDDWVPFGCEAYSDDAYIDHELTECFGNPDPILTLSKTAILG